VDNYVHGRCRKKAYIAARSCLHSEICGRDRGRGGIVKKDEEIQRNWANLPVSDVFGIFGISRTNRGGSD
jgi:hypothetical protein